MMTMKKVDLSNLVSKKPKKGSDYEDEGDDEASAGI
jgi:hypothetical protein